MHGRQTLSGYSNIFTELGDRIVAPTTPIHEWKKDLPTRFELHGTKFGQPSKNHSFTQEMSFETFMTTVLTSGNVSYCEFTTLCETQVLIQHIAKMFIKCHSYDFTWIAYEDPF